jgi:hypothetical protein
VWNQRRKKANKELRQQNVELKKLHDELSKVATLPIILSLTLTCNAHPLLYPQQVKRIRVVTEIRNSDRWKGLSLEFEAFVRSVLACECSARQARDTILLTAQFLLPASAVSLPNPNLNPPPNPNPLPIPRPNASRSFVVPP